MGGLFSYESKPMQILMFLGDIIILNIMYLLFCIPLFTIGAAQSGMFTACKVLLDKEDDSSIYAAFWRGFTNGFGTVTLAWGVMTGVLLVVVYGAITAFMLQSSAWPVLLAVLLCSSFQVMVPAFHSRFGCKWWQLIRNTWFLFFAHPLRTIASTLFISFPTIYFIICCYYEYLAPDRLPGSLGAFLAMAPVWCTLYFGTAFCFATSFLKKPFKVLTEHFNKLHGLDADGNPLPAEEEDSAQEPTEE